MVYRCLAVLLLLGIIAVGSLSSPRPSWADTLVQQNVDTRVVLAFRVGQAALQSWLPAPWQVNPVATGPSKDANLLINFIDRVLNQDAEGKLVAGGYDRLVSVNMPAKHPETGKAGPFVMRIFTVNPQSIPGNDKTSVQASVRREQALKWVDLEPGVGSELWEVRGTAGGMIGLQLQYRGAVPARANVEAKPRSPVNPEFFRIYHIDQGVDVVKSIPQGIDRVQHYQLRVTVSELGKLFDGTEQQPSSRHPLRWWGVSSTLFGKHQFDQHPRLYSA
jgi:hypothetical protein